MLKLLPQNDFVTLKTTNPDKAVNFLKHYIQTHSCECISIDISNLNIIDACHVSTLCSAEHFIKYPNGNINWRISSEMVQLLNVSLDLGNSYYYF